MPNYAILNFWTPHVGTNYVYRTWIAQSRCFQLLTFYFRTDRFLLQEMLPFPAFPFGMISVWTGLELRSRFSGLSAVISITCRSSVSCCNLQPSIWPISIIISNTGPQTHLAPCLIALAWRPAEHLAVLHRVEMWLIADSLYWIENTHATPIACAQSPTYLLTHTNTGHT